MKTRFLFLLLLSLLVHVQAQKDERIKFEGTVGEYPVTLYLYAGTGVDIGVNNFAGLYYYDSQLIPLELFYSAEEKHTELRLDHWGSAGFESFHGTLSEDTFSGTWEKDERTLPFSLSTVPFSEYEIPMEFHSKELTVPLGLKSEEGEIKGVYEMFYLLPKDSEIQVKMMRQFDESYTGFTDFSERELGDFKEEYLKMEKWVKEEEAPVGFWMNYEFLDRVTPWLETKKWLTLSFYYYSYTGGAHGNYAQVFTTWDKEKQRLLLPDDVWESKYDEEIRKLLLESARKQYEIPENEPLTSEEYWTPFFSDEVALTGNFTLAENGIIFHYNPYEIAAYAAGIVSLFVSYESLKPYLNPDFSFR